METSNMDMEEVQRRCERVAHRSGQNSSAAPATAATGTGTQGSIMRFCINPHLCLLLLQRIPQNSSPTSQRKRLPPRLPQQSPSISQARHLLLRPLRQRCKPPRSGFAASQNATASPAPLSRGCLSSSTASSITTKPPTTKCRHTSFITPLPAWSVAAKLLCNH